jgi:hypothetical protein
VCLRPTSGYTLCQERHYPCKNRRHSHPHKDPRQPRHCAIPGTNPPVFAWKPLAGQTSFGLHITRDPAFNQLALDVPALNDCLFLPARALPSGRYFWRWISGQFVSPVFEFTLTKTATVVEIPPVDAWLQALPQQHPRIYLRPEEVENLRTRANPGRTGLHDQLLRDANALLVESHQISEPPKLPDKKRDYNAFFSRWYPTLWNSRRFVKGAETLALAHLATNDVAYWSRRLCAYGRYLPLGPRRHQSYKPQRRSPYVIDLARGQCL